MSRKSYTFVTANMGDCDIDIVGEWVGKEYDIAVECGDLYREFGEIDAGSADDIFAWLMSEGVEFESTRSLWFNMKYVQHVMMDRDATEGRLLDEAARLDEQWLEEWREAVFF